MAWRVPNPFATRPIVYARSAAGIDPLMPEGQALLRKTRPDRPDYFRTRERHAVSNAGTDVMLAAAPAAPKDDAEVVTAMTNALDVAALMFIEILRNDEKDESGEYKIDLKTRMEAFKLARDWHAVRAKSKKKDAAVGADGIKAYREVMDKTAKQSVQKALRTARIKTVGAKTNAQKRREEMQRLSGPAVRVDASEIEKQLKRLNAGDDHVNGDEDHASG